MSKPKTLTPREKLFVGHYLIDLDPKVAALFAGYSKSMAESKAYQWVSNGKVKPHVFNEIQKQLEKRSDRTQLTQDMVIAGLMVEADKTQDDTTPASRVSAWGLLGKHLAMFTDKVEGKTTVEVGNSLAQLMKEIDGGTRTK